MALGGNEVRVHYAFTDAFDDPAQLDALAELLDDGERARRARFRFERDRHIYLIAHAMVRSVLAELTGLPARELAFDAGEHGKPELTTPGAAPGLRFNLSHTHGLVACAVTHRHDLGVDVEQRDRRIELEQVARSVYSPIELEALLAREGEARRRRFFELWTLKEAYIKAVGRGLSMPLRQITLHLDRGPVALDLSASDLGDGGEWQLWLAEPGTEHQLGVAIRSRAAEAPELCPWNGDLS